MAKIDAKPVFVDNKDGNTLARAITERLWVLGRGKRPLPRPARDTSGLGPSPEADGGPIISRIAPR